MLGVTVWGLPQGINDYELNTIKIGIANPLLFYLHLHTDDVAVFIPLERSPDRFADKVFVKVEDVQIPPGPIPHHPNVIRWTLNKIADDIAKEIEEHLVTHQLFSRVRRRQARLMWVKVSLEDREGQKAFIEKRRELVAT